MTSIYINLECIETLKTRKNGRIGTTDSKYPIRNSFNTRNKIEWKQSNQKK